MEKKKQKVELQKRGNSMVPAQSPAIAGVVPGRHNVVQTYLYYHNLPERTWTETYHLSPEIIEEMKRLRVIERRLMACDLENLMTVRAEIIQELMDPEGEWRLSKSPAYRLMSGMTEWLTDARKMDKAAHRLVLDARNARAWAYACDNKDVAGMNAADQNYIRVHQLDEPDEEKLDADAIAVPNVMATTRYSDVKEGTVDVPVWEAIRAAEKIAKAGIIELKEGKDFTVTDVMEFDELEQSAEELESKPL